MSQVQVKRIINGRRVSFDDVCEDDKGAMIMTQYTIKTNEDEVKAILNGEKRYIIRSEKDAIKKGDEIRFQLMKQQKPVYHQISKFKYVVTIVDDYLTAPIAKGCKLISFKVAR